MGDSESRKVPEELADEALGNVAGGMTASDLMKYINFVKQFKNNSNCYNCRSYWDCTILDMDYEDVFAMFNGDPNAKCSNFKS